MKKKYKIIHLFDSTSILLVFMLFCSLSILGQSHPHPHNNIIEVDWDIEKYYPNPYTEMSSIPAPTGVQQRMAGGGGCSTFIVTYNGFTPEAQAAFQYAVDIWASSVDSPVPIRVTANFTPLPTGVLGSAGPASFRQITGSGFPANTAFPIALAENIIGAEIMDGPLPSTDISATFSSTANFYFGLDASPAPTQIDFVTVVLHELCHGLGFLGFGRIPTDGSGNPDPNPPVNGVLRNNGFLAPWDYFIEDGSQTDITTLVDPSPALLTAFTGNDLFSNGPTAIGQNGGVKPTMYAPSTFQTGSSYSHWDESTYPAGNPNSLMSPFISFGEAIHDPGLMTLAFMEDMGWSICGGSLSTIEFNAESVAIGPNPFTSSIDILLANKADEDFVVDFFDVNGRKVISKTLSSINGRITLSNLKNLENAFYIVKITNQLSGNSVTKKIIKN